MPLNQHSTALTTAIFAFFAVSIIGAIYKNAPATCCKRAVIAMLAVYLFVSIIIKIINAVLVNAMISKQISKKLKGNASNGGKR